ncbi:helix-turn-helix domain-containing protein [Mucilaginibacter sp.]|uniref:helix-turn-helix domain-containing protein n=1 Tax=Mucilaginibacter sp. TaxID=1882438 RepID=UPI003D096E7F
MKDIPVHQLRDRQKLGLEIKQFVQGETPKDIETLGAHRDDHYLFFLMEEGTASLMIDFREVIFNSNVLYYILPGQVHHRIRNEGSGGWFLAVDTMLVAPAYRNIFENHLLLQQPYYLSATQLAQCQTTLNLLREKYTEDELSPFFIQIVHSLLQSFLGMVAGCYSQVYKSNQQASRPAQLSQEFKKLLVENVRTLKSPSAYAEKLNVSESYLNEALKKVTGFSVSYWILHEVMLEAKRLLYYSLLNVKEIAHDLGYTDHAYFSRLFKKSTGTTPLIFRGNYRK